MLYDNLHVSQVNPCPPGTVGYTIKAGDTFASIASRYGITVSAIINANPGLDPNRLEIGRQICVPAPAPNSCPGGVIYTIQPGDTFYTLAARYNTTVQAIIAANPGVNPDALRIGQTICIPGTTPVPPAIKLPCCSILEPTSTNLPPLPDLPAIPEGTVLTRQVAVSANVYALLFAANGLPAPNTLGNYDSYSGTIYLSGTGSQGHSAFLASGSPKGQPVTWSGTLILAETPRPGNTLEIRPANSGTGRMGGAILRGSLGNCR